MFYTAAFTLVATLTVANALGLQERQSCPKIHVFGARETTVSPGYGTSWNVVNSVLQAYPGSTSEAIVYPACGGQSSCGGISYDSSATQGTTAVVNAVVSLNQRCPSTQIVLIGYSQVSGSPKNSAICQDRY
jgi:acetylxylan esterase